RTDTDLVSEFDVTRSGAPSPLRSALVIDQGNVPTGSCPSSRKVPSFWLRRTLSVFSPSATRSGYPSPFVSATAIGRRPSRGAYAEGGSNLPLPRFRNTYT